MFITIWTLIVIVCITLALTHPTKRGVGLGLIFISGIITPYFVGAVILELPQPEMHLLNCLSAFTVIMGLLYVLSKDCKLDKLFSNLFILSIVEVGLNILGLYSWNNYTYIHVSNYIVDITGGTSLVVLLGENWIYNSLLIVLYTIVAYVLYDRDNRKQYVGNGVLHFPSDTKYNFNLLYKDVEECSEKQKS